MSFTGSHTSRFPSSNSLHTKIAPNWLFYSKYLLPLPVGWKLFQQSNELYSTFQYVFSCVIESPKWRNLCLPLLLITSFVIFPLLSMLYTLATLHLDNGPPNDDLLLGGSLLINVGMTRFFYGILRGFGASRPKW